MSGSGPPEPGVSEPDRPGPPVVEVSAVDHIQEAAPVPIVGPPSPVVVVVGLGRPQPGQVEAAVVVELVEGDDEVPEPGGGEVGPHQDGAQGDGQHAVEEEVQRVTVGCGNSYGSPPVVVALWGFRRYQISDISSFTLEIQNWTL